MTDYFVQRGADETVLALYRIRRLPDAIYTELLRDGRWIEWPSAGDFLFDRDPRDAIDETEAAAIARRMGGHL
jgi:hypothetical protein